MNFSLGSSEFAYVLQSSKSTKIGEIQIKYIPYNTPALGLIVSKKYGNAVQRNLFKRRCRAIFRNLFINNQTNYALIVRPMKSIQTYRSIYEAFNNLYIKIAHE